MQVSDAEVAERVRDHAFVLNADLPPLRTADQWWNEDAHKRLLRDESEKVYAWLVPFVSSDVLKLEQLQPIRQTGLRGLGTLAKALRALIRDRRKLKEPSQELLIALYGTCVAADFAKSLSFEGNYVAAHVDLKDLQQVRIDYATMGYQFVESLSKTDIKWLIEAFGEPAEHESFEALWPNIRRNAVVRYCSGELRSKNDAARSLGWKQQSMHEWLCKLVERNIDYHKEWEERVAAWRVYLAESAQELDAAWAATQVPFVVADIETTGLNAERDDVLEVAALRCDRGGSVSGEFSALVRIPVRVPAEIERLTGITQVAVDREGRPLSDVMRAFATFAGSCPVFFHNAPFDAGFLRGASKITGVHFANPVHDTLLLARQAWPTLGTYRLAALADYVGSPRPTPSARRRYGDLGCPVGR